MTTEQKGSKKTMDCLVPFMVNPFLNLTSFSGTDRQTDKSPANPFKIKQKPIYSNALKLHCTKLKDLRYTILRHSNIWGFI